MHKLKLRALISGTAVGFKSADVCRERKPLLCSSARHVGTVLSAVLRDRPELCIGKMLQQREQRASVLLPW